MLTNYYLFNINYKTPVGFLQELIKFNLLLRCLVVLLVLFSKVNTQTSYKNNREVLNRSYYTILWSSLWNDFQIRSTHTLA